MRSSRERFESKVYYDPNSGCHLWTDHTDKKSYGKFRVGDFMRSAHRVSFEMYRGDIPEGLLICHSCDNPLCVNPEHLFVGTHSDNTKDMDRKGRRVGSSIKVETPLGLFDSKKAAGDAHGITGEGIAWRIKQLTFKDYILVGGYSN